MGGKAWTPQDIAYVEESISTMTAKDIATHLNRTPSSIWKVLHRHGMTSPRGPRVPHRDYLIRVGDIMPTKELARMTGRHPRSIAQLLHREGRRPRGCITHHAGGLTIKWTPEEYKRLNEVLAGRYLTPKVSFVAHEWLSGRVTG